MGNTEQADISFKRPSRYHKFIKVRKRRIERHKAKQNPEAQPTYGKYTGWES